MKFDAEELDLITDTVFENMSSKNKAWNDAIWVKMKLVF